MGNLNFCKNLFWNFSSISIFDIKLHQKHESEVCSQIWKKMKFEFFTNFTYYNMGNFTFFTIFSKTFHRIFLIFDIKLYDKHGSLKFVHNFGNFEIKIVHNFFLICPIINIWGNLKFIKNIILSIKLFIKFW